MYVNIYKRATFFISLIIFFCFISNIVVAQQLAFPGAEGFGKYATGGRGGKVVEVTNLNDAGTGSFRDAFTQFPGEPITIVFKVGGTIELKTALKVTRSNITVAGQTAPGDGICLKGHSFLLNGARAASQGGNHGNIIIRHLRSRPGSNLSTGVYGFDMENCHDVIVDHCSFTWANEECAAMYDTKNVTVQWSLIAEGLYSAGHAKGVRSYVGVWGGQYASYHHNLLTNSVSRTVRFNGARAHDTLAVIDYRNNVIYNWGSSGACYGGEVEITNGKSQVNIINNYYKPGPATSTTLKFVQASYTASLAKGVGEWYATGNTMIGNTAMTSDNWLGVDLNSIPADQRSAAKSSSPFEVGNAALPIQTAEDAYNAVLKNAGAIIPKRDTVDRRLVNETITKTATGMGSYGKPGIIDTVSAVGGWPVYVSANPPADIDHDGIADDWEMVNGLSPSNPDDRNNIGADGYTMLEKYLNASTNTVLPLKLISFNGARMEGAVNLFWTTSAETGTDAFQIERSINGIEFTAIATVPAVNSIGNNKYSFKDNLLPEGTLYYRLLIKDKDGRSSYSQVLLFGTNLKNNLSVYPNPARNIITISHLKAGPSTKMRIYTINGQLKLAYNMMVGVEQSSIDVSNLTPGIYSVVLSNNSEKKVQQFVKQ